MFFWRLMLNRSYMRSFAYGFFVANNLNCDMVFYLINHFKILPTLPYLILSFISSFLLISLALTLISVFSHELKVLKTFSLHNITILISLNNTKHSIL